MGTQNKKEDHMSEDSQRKDAYHIKSLGEGKRAIWTRIGSAFVNKDGSLNVFLDTIPIDGKVHIRDPKPNNKE